MVPGARRLDDTGEHTRQSYGVFVVAEDDAALASYRAGHDEPRVGGRDGRTVQRFEGGDRRLRHDVPADGTFEPPGGRRIGFPVMVVGRHRRRHRSRRRRRRRLLDGRQTDGGGG